jgi:phosphoribosylanthranilate isomerase
MVKVKICGITNLEDALAAVEYGADAVGFIFAASRRWTTIETVQSIIAELPPSVRKVGVFVDEDVLKIKETMAFCGLDFAQLHGNESPDDCDVLFPEVIKSFTRDNLPAEAELEQYRACSFLFDREKGDSTSPEELWETAGKFARQHRMILAGGLNHLNIVRAIETVCPYAVDVASGVESKPGKKDLKIMRDFISKAKEV